MNDDCRSGSIPDVRQYRAQPGIGLISILQEL